jgi:hypothetical protein
MNKYVYIGYVAVFLLIIYLPLAVSLLGLEKESENLENRKKAEIPTLTFENVSTYSGIKKGLGFYRGLFAFTEGFDSYYKDNFGLRMKYFNLFKQIKMNIFHVSISPESMIKGEDGWYFLGNKHAQVVAQSKGMIRFNEQELAEITSSIKEKENYFNSKDIQFYIAIAPNKHTVYGEYIPIKQSEQPTQRQQVFELFKNNRRIIDLGKQFGTYKQKNIQLYHKIDSHWNDYGAFLAYQTFMEILQKDFPDIEYLTFNDFTIEEKESPNDLTRIFDLKINEKTFYFNFKEVEKAILQDKQLKIPAGFHMKPDLYEIRYRCPEKPLKILIFRDSFSDAWLKYLKETFGETVLIWSYGFNQEIIEQEKPDIVLYEIVERHISAISSK